VHPAGRVEKESRDCAGRIDSEACRPRGAWHVERGEGPMGSPQKAVESVGEIVSRERACGVNREDYHECGARSLKGGDCPVGGADEAMRHVASVSVSSCGRTRRIDADREAGKISRDEGPGIGPASHLIAAAIDHGVDEVFRLVTILPFPSLRAFRTLGMTTQNIDQETTQDNCQIHTLRCQFANYLAELFARFLA